MRPDCDNSSECSKNCCISLYAAPLFFISFVLFAQFVLVNIVIAVLMKHLRVTKLCKGNLTSRKNSMRRTPSVKEEAKQEPALGAFKKWHVTAGKRKAERIEMLEKQINDTNTKQSTDDVKPRQYHTHLEDKLDKDPEDNVNNNVRTRNQGENLLEKGLKVKNNHHQTRSLTERPWQNNPSFRSHFESSPDSKSESVKYESESEENLGSIEIMSNAVIVQDEMFQDGSGCEVHVTDDESHDFSIEIPEDDENNLEGDCYCSCCMDENNKDIEMNEIKSTDEDNYVDDIIECRDNGLLNNASDMTINELICQYEEDRISFTGSPVLNIPDDFFSEDETTPLKSKLSEGQTDDDHIDLDTEMRNDTKPRLSSVLSRSESLQTCGSFEILTECLELYEITDNADGSNESFALVDSDSTNMKMPKV